MINVSQFMNEVSKRGYTKETLADKLGLDTRIFSQKLEGCCNCFTIKEVICLVEILQLEGGEAEKIFFYNVAQNAIY